MLRKQLKLGIAALVATSLCMSSVVPAQSQPAPPSIQIQIGFGNGDYDIDTFFSYHDGQRNGDHLRPPTHCSSDLLSEKMPDLNITLVDEAGVERKTINAKDLVLSRENDRTPDCTAIATFYNLSDGTYSLKVQYDNTKYALFNGRKKLEGKAEQIVERYETTELDKLVENSLQINQSLKKYYHHLSFTLTHRPLALKYKTEFGTFEHDGQDVQEAVIYPRRDGEAAQWFEHATWDNVQPDTGESFVGIGVPYGAVPAKPLERRIYPSFIDEHKMGQFPQRPTWKEDEKEKYAGYKWLGWAAYPWDATEFTEATQLRDANGKPIVYTDTETGGEFPAYEDTFFVAKWEIPTRTISFKTAADEGTINGGTTVEYTFEGNDSLKTLNKEVPKPVALPGYEFVGWFTDLSGNTIAEKEIFEKWNTSSVQYYAKYRPVQTSPTVKNYTFDFNPGAGKIVKGEQSYQVQDNSRVDDVPQVEAPEGQEFVGWKRVSDDTLYTNIAELVWRNKATSDRSFIAVFKTIEQPAKECKPGKSSKNSWLIILLPIVAGTIAAVIPVVNKFLAGIVENLKPQALKDFEAWLAQRTGSSASEETQAVGTAITASTVLGVLSWLWFSKQEDQC